MPPITTGVSKPGPAQRVDHRGGEREVGAVVHGDADDVDILLRRHGRDRLGRLAQPRVDHFAAGVAQDPRHHPQAAVVAVEPDLGHQHAEWPLVGAGHAQATWRSV